MGGQFQRSRGPNPRMNMANMQRPSGAPMMAPMMTARPGMPPQGMPQVQPNANVGGGPNVRANYKYTAGVRNVAGGQVVPVAPNQSCNLKLHRLLYSFKVKSHLLHLCWQQRHLTSKNKCWENVCSLLSNRCIQNWPVKSLVCFWKLTTLNWCTCWNTKNRSRVKSKRPWLCFKPTKLSQLSKFLQEKKMKKKSSKSLFQEKRLSFFASTWKRKTKQKQK